MPRFYVYYAYYYYYSTISSSKIYKILIVCRKETYTKIILLVLLKVIANRKIQKLIIFVLRLGHSTFLVNQLIAIINFKYTWLFVL